MRSPARLCQWLMDRYGIGLPVGRIRAKPDALDQRRSRLRRRAVLVVGCILVVIWVGFHAASAVEGLSRSNPTALSAWTTMSVFLGLSLGGFGRYGSNGSWPALSPACGPVDC